MTLQSDMTLAGNRPDHLLSCTVRLEIIPQSTRPSRVKITITRPQLHLTHQSLTMIP